MNSPIRSEEARPLAPCANVTTPEPSEPMPSAPVLCNDEPAPLTSTVAALRDWMPSATAPLSCAKAPFLTSSRLEPATASRVSPEWSQRVPAPSKLNTP